MELLYFISGILSLGIIYGIILLRTIKLSHDDLLARHQSQSNISSVRFSEMVDDMGSLSNLVRDIESGMKTDQYENLAKINTSWETDGTKNIYTPDAKKVLKEKSCHFCVSGNMASKG